MVDTLCNNLKVLRFINDPVPSNAYLILDGMGSHCIAIDPGTKYQKNLIDYIKDHHLNLDYILLTHEHFDHCWGVNSLLNEFSSKVVATRLCAEWVCTPMNYFNKLYYDSDEMYSINHIDVLAEEIDWKLKWGDVEIDLIDAKGHTNRGVCISVGNAMFSGDTLLLNTKPFLKKKYGASLEDLKSTIIKIFNTYENNTIVFPGHGAPFYLGEAKSFYLELFGVF